MLAQERWPVDETERQRNWFKRHLNEIWTALVGTVVADSNGHIAQVQSAIQDRQLQSDETTYKDVNITTLPKEGPVHMPGGGGFTFYHPVAKGDEVLVVFSTLCIDNWWQKGAANGPQPQFDPGRRQDLSDGFVIPGFRSLPRKHSPALSTTSAGVRTDDGTTYLEVANGQVINLVGPNGITAKVTNSGKAFVIEGDLHVTGAIIAGYGTGDQVTLQNHLHKQDPDSHGDTEQDTHPPTAGT